MSLLLNVGSGQRRFAAPWVNVDCLSRDGEVPDVVSRGEALAFRTESAQCVVLHHVLEHFGCNEADQLISECWRVLEPAGSLLIFVPDLRALAQRWLTRQLDTQVYVTALYGAYKGEPGDRHRWGFDRDSLNEYLGRWGKTKPFDGRTIPGSDLVKDWWILSAEVVK